jgi:hypothetical protein
MLGVKYRSVYNTLPNRRVSLDIYEIDVAAWIAAPKTRRPDGETVAHLSLGSSFADDLV